MLEARDVDQWYHICLACIKALSSICKGRGARVTTKRKASNNFTM